MLVQVVLYEEFDLLDAVAPYEVLAAAQMFAGDGHLSYEFASAEGPGPVTSRPSAVPLPATSTIDLERADAIIVPGVAGDPDEIPRLLAAALETPLRESLEAAIASPSVTVYTVCGGSLLLAMAGLIEVRPAVTHFMGMEVLEATGAIPVNARVVDDGDVVSSGGVTSGLDLGLYFVERELGPRIALSVEELFEYERRGTVWRPTGLEVIAA